MFLQGCAMTLGSPPWRGTAWQGRRGFLCSGVRRTTQSGELFLTQLSMPAVLDHCRESVLTSPQGCTAWSSSAQSSSGLHVLNICSILCRYEIFAISKPATLLALASYPLTRYYQRRFRRESLSAVSAAAGASH